MTATPASTPQPSTAKKLGVIVGVGFALLIWSAISAVLGVPGMIVNVVAAVAVLVLGKRLPPITPRKTVVVMLVLALLIGFAGKASREKAAKDDEVALVQAPTPTPTPTQAQIQRKAQTQALVEGQRNRRAAIFTEAEAAHQTGDVRAGLAKLDELGDNIPDRQDRDRRDALKKAWEAEIGGKFTAEVDAAIAKARAAAREGKGKDALLTLDAINGDALFAPNAAAAAALMEAILGNMGMDSIEKVLNGMTTLQLEALVDAGITPEMTYHADPDVSAGIRARLSANRELAAKIIADRAASAPWTVATFTSQIPMLAERTPTESKTKDGTSRRMWSFKPKAGDKFTAFVVLDGEPNAISSIETSATVFSSKDEKLATVMASAFSAKVISVATGLSVDEVITLIYKDAVEKKFVKNGFKIDKSVIGATGGALILVEISPAR